MSTNWIQLTPGVSATFTVGLTDAYGDPLPFHRLANAGAQVYVRTTPSGSNVLLFQTPDAAHVVVDQWRSTITVNFLVADTNMLTVGTSYFWQVELDLADGEVILPIPWTPVNVTLGGSSSTPPPPFPSTVAVTQDFPTPGAMLYQTPGGHGIEGAQVRVFLQSDFQSGNFNNPVGTTTTGCGGKWASSIMVSPGYTYVAQFCKPYAFGPDTYTFFA